MAVERIAARPDAYDRIHERHFVQMTMSAGMSNKCAMATVEEILAKAPEALEAIENTLPIGFLTAVIHFVSDAETDRLRGLQ